MRRARSATPVPLIALALTPLSTHAAPPAAATTSLANTVAYTTVPDTLDPTEASDSTLAQYGFPPRPDRTANPASYHAWKEAVNGMQRIAPSLQPIGLYQEPMQPSANGPLANGSATSSNWSGYVVPAPAFSYGNQSLTNVYGDWIVPVAQPAFNGCFRHTSGSAVYSSTWVGIDGSGSGDVLQAGTESDAVCSDGTVGAYQGAWYEWYPYDEVRVTNLPVAPGAAIYVHVWADSATHGHAYFANKSTHQAISIAFDAPPGTKLIGNSAEWVVERPAVDGALATLTNYVQEFMANAQATDAQGRSYFAGQGSTANTQPALQVQMTDTSAQVISVPTLLGQDSIWFSDQGSAKHIPHP
jgi:hypothetical protein